METNIQTATKSKTTKKTATKPAPRKKENRREVGAVQTFELPGVGTLRGRALLVDLTVHYWTPKATDKELSEETIQKHNTDGSFSKQLIDRLVVKKLHSVMKNVESVHKQFTCPWKDGGERILSASTLLRYREEMRKAIEAYMAEADAVCAQWNRLVAAKRSSDRSFKAEHYPSAGEIRGRYGAEIHYSPVPAGDDLRVALSDDELAAVRESIDGDQQTRIKAAVFDVATRVKKVLEHMSTTLKEYKPATKEAKAENTFRDSLVVNVREIADLIPAINITGDPRIDQWAVDMRKLAEVAPDSLREDEKTRNTTVEKADAILKRVSDFI